MHTDNDTYFVIKMSPLIFSKIIKKTKKKKFSKDLNKKKQTYYYLIDYV